MAEVKRWVVMGADGRVIGEVALVDGVFEGPPDFIHSLVFRSRPWSNGYISTAPVDKER